MRAALEFIDRRCLDELSMRKLGTQLGVEAMSLYRYFPSKAELLDAVVDEVAADLEIPAAGGDWREGVRHFAHAFRELAGAHPGIVPLLTAAPDAHPGMQRATEAVTATLRRAGFGGDTLPRAQCAVMGYVLGSTIWLAGAAPGSRIHPDAQFRFGLDVLLSGLGRELENNRPG